MLTEILENLIKMGVALFLGILGGNALVYAINHMPAAWLCDYGEEPKLPEDEAGVQRVKSHPWKAAFSALFCVEFVWLFSEYTLYYALPSCVFLWLVCSVGVCDRKYMIIPDQLTLALCITALGFVPLHTGSIDAPFGEISLSAWLEPLYGALLGGASMALVAIFGRLITRKESLGFGDIKLFSAIGLCLGLKGTAFVIVFTSFASCMAYALLLLRKKIKSGDSRPLADIVAAVSSLYILFSRFIGAF